MTHLDSAVASWHIPDLPVELRVGYEQIGRKYRIPLKDVEKIVSRVEGLCIG